MLVYYYNHDIKYLTAYKINYRATRSLLVIIQHFVQIILSTVVLVRKIYSLFNKWMRKYSFIHRQQNIMRYWTLSIFSMSITIKKYIKHYRPFLNVIRNFLFHLYFHVLYLTTLIVSKLQPCICIIIWYNNKYYLL